MSLGSSLRRWLGRLPLLWRLADSAPPDAADAPPEGPDGVRTVGHRAYVGGMWWEIGRLQFSFLVEQGLRPHHYLLDIGCGALRAGIHLVPFLDAGHYMGIDREETLIRRGVEQELGQALLELKQPDLRVSSDFDFQQFGQAPDYALAQSLFTHLTDRDIRRCLRSLHRVAPSHARLYATFFEARETVANPDRSHAHLPFRYTVEEMEEMARETGWRLTYLGDWDHPRDQQMLLYRPR